MSIPRFKLIAELSEFPSGDLSDIMLDFRDLVRSKPSLTQSLAKYDISSDAAKDLCTLIVDFFFSEIKQRISPIISEWENKAVSIYSHIRPEQCFFGVEERRILKDTYNILPKFFSGVFTNNKQRIKCGSVYELSWFLAEHIAMMTTEDVAMQLPTLYRCMQFVNVGSKLQHFEKMTALISKLAKCLHYGECQCGALTKDDPFTCHSLDDQDGQTIYLSLRKDGFEVDYYTSNRAVMEILIKTANTDAEEDLDLPCISRHKRQFDAHRDKASDDLKAQVLFSLVLTGLVNETLEKAHATLSTEDFNRIVKNLTKKAKQQIKLSTVGTIKADDVEIYKVLFKDLHEKIGSKWDLLTAMESQVIDDIIIEALRVRLTNPPTQESTLARFFSSVGQLIRKPFSDGLVTAPPQTNEPL